MTLTIYFWPRMPSHRTIELDASKEPAAGASPGELQHASSACKDIRAVVNQILGMSQSVVLKHIILLFLGKEIAGKLLFTNAANTVIQTITFLNYHHRVIISQEHAAAQRDGLDQAAAGLGGKFGEAGGSFRDAGGNAAGVAAQRERHVDALNQPPLAAAGCGGRPGAKRVVLVRGREVAVHLVLCLHFIKFEVVGCGGCSGDCHPLVALPYNALHQTNSTSELGDNPMLFCFQIHWPMQQGITLLIVIAAV